MDRTLIHYVSTACTPLSTTLLVSNHSTGNSHAVGGNTTLLCPLFLFVSFPRSLSRSDEEVKLSLSPRQSGKRHSICTISITSNRPTAEDLVCPRLNRVPRSTDRHHGSRIPRVCCSAVLQQFGDYYIPVCLIILMLA